MGAAFQPRIDSDWIGADRGWKAAPTTNNHLCWQSMLLQGPIFIGRVPEWISKKEISCLSTGIPKSKADLSYWVSSGSYLEILMRFYSRVTPHSARKAFSASNPPLFDRGQSGQVKALQFRTWNGAKTYPGYRRQLYNEIMSDKIVRLPHLTVNPAGCDDQWEVQRRPRTRRFSFHENCQMSGCGCRVSRLWRSYDEGKRYSKS